MSALVVDASVAAKWFLREDFCDESLSILDERHQLHAPDFFYLEIDNIICKWIRRGIISDSEGRGTRKAVRSVPIHAHPFVNLQDSAYHIAVRTHRSMYDCLYVALAVLIDGRMVTADRRLFKEFASGPLGEYMLWIGDVGES